MSVPTFDIYLFSYSTPVAIGFSIDGIYREVLKTSEDCDVVWTFLQYLSQYKGLKIYAQGASDSENRYILASLTAHGQSVQFLAGLGRIVWVETNISFEDSHLLLGRPLPAVCDALEVSRTLDLSILKGDSAWERQAQPDAFRAYLKRDVLTLGECIDKYAQLLLDLFGITPSVTMSLTAVKAFGHKFYPLAEIESNLEFEKYIRAATYGGRNEVYQRYGESVLMYDVRGMFVSCYDVPVPIGKLRWTSPSLDKGTIVEAKVKVPTTMNIGPLPHKYKGRLCFPVGEFQDVWDVVELRNAVKQGVDVSLIRQLECEELPILKDFGVAMGTLRETTNEELSRIWKLFGLRLSGKFGQKRVRTEIRHIKEIEDLTGWEPMDDSEVYHVKQLPLNGNRSPYIKPAVSMRIRAEARVRHYNILTSVKDVFYCDTDSVYTKEALPVGPKLGELHLIGYAQRAYFIGCKLYGYIDEYGSLRQKTSGISDYRLGEYEFRQLLEGETVDYTDRHLENWREILKGKGVKSLPRTIPLSLPNQDNRIMDGIETKPIRLPER